MNRKIAVSLLLLALVLPPGCISTYVGDPEKSTADAELVGLWHGKNKDGNDELWYVHSLDKRSYLIQFYVFNKPDGKLAKNDDPITIHAWLTSVGGQRFISLKFFSPQLLTQAKSEEAAKRYAVARLTSTANGLSVRALEPKFVEANNLTTPALLEAAIAQHLNDDAIYGETRDLVRIDPANPGDAKELIELVK